MITSVLHLKHNIITLGLRTLKLVILQILIITMEVPVSSNLVAAYPSRVRRNGRTAVREKGKEVRENGRKRRKNGSGSVKRGEPREKQRKQRKRGAAESSPDREQNPPAGRAVQDRPSATQSAGVLRPEACSASGSSPAVSKEERASKKAKLERPTSGCPLHPENESSCQGEQQKPEDKFSDLYEKGELLGTGSYGSVFAGIRKADNLPVAVKYIDRTSVANWATMPQQREPVPLEAALHQQVSAAPSCPGVVGLLDSFTEPESCLLVLERPVPCMDLYDFVMQKGGHLDEPMAKDFLRQVVQALQHCHTRGVVHRDLKMENILVESISHRLKLIDFGLASRLRDGFYRDQAGTLEFFAPETVRVGRYRALPATVWSVGVLLYVLLCGSYPFCDGRAIIQGKLSFPSGLSKDCCDLIRSCCNMTAASRPTLEEILLHPWMA